MPQFLATVKQVNTPKNRIEQSIKEQKLVLIPHKDPNPSAPYTSKQQVGRPIYKQTTGRPDQKF